MLEMRDALTAEVAEKHDIILLLKQDVLRLEEQCLQTNKHAQFKDDIIKELRREIKQLKQKLPVSVINIHYYSSYRRIHLMVVFIGWEQATKCW